MRRETRFTSVQPETWKRVYERDNKRCVLCGTAGTYRPPISSRAPTAA